MLSGMSEVGLIARFHKLGLLPKERRKKFVERVIAYDVEGITCRG
jgi:hypothetical protein